MAGALVGVVAILPYVLTLLDELPGSVKDALPSPWKWGLLAAMLAHFTADIVLHVAAPLVIH
jgi:hypothetical protein